MKKTIVCTAAFAFVFSFAVAGVSMASNHGPETITLTSSKAKKPAQFPHKAHQDKFDCGTCHHTMSDGKQVPYSEGMEIQKCETCHNSSFADKKLNSFMKAGHARCKTCHKEKGVSTSCKTCHP